jgi:hypothetical protein
MITNNPSLVDPISNTDNQEVNSLIHRVYNVINRIILEDNILTSNRSLNTISDVSSTTYTRIPSPTYSVDSETSNDESDEDYEDYEDNLEQDSNSSAISTTDSEDSYTYNIYERSSCDTPEGYQSWSGSESGDEYHHRDDDDESQLL